MSEAPIPVPVIRPRRLRRAAALRRMVRETELNPGDFIYPLFVTHGEALRQPIPSMPGIFQLSIDQLAEEACEVAPVSYTHLTLPTMK